MRVLLYEFLTGGGWRASTRQPPPSCLAREALAMVRTIGADLASIDGLQLVQIWDERLGSPPTNRADWRTVRTESDEQRMIADEAARCDWSLIIAPETSGWLLERSRWVADAGGRLLGPALPAISLCSDKQRTAEHLTAHGVPVPTGIYLAAGQRLPQDFPLPAVVKPVDGCGSQNIRLIESDDRHWRAAAPSRLEQFWPGTACSVSFLCGPHQRLALLPCIQRLGGPSGFDYLGGELPLAGSLWGRAVSLAAKAVSSMPGLLGYVGVDLVLGNHLSGQADAVIEVNPRFTTSYVGLRAAASVNLAQTLLETAGGGTVKIAWHSGRWQFDADGTLRQMARA